MINSITELENAVKVGNYPEDAIWNASPDQCFILAQAWYEGNPETKQLFQDTFMGRKINSIWEHEPKKMELVSADGSTIYLEASLPQ